MEQLTPEYIAKGMKIPIELATRLLEGIKKEDLEDEIRRANPDLNDAAVDVARMNLAAGLRSWGYTLEGGRQNRSAPYKITGYEPPKEKQTVDVWGGSTRKWVQERTKLDESEHHRNLIRWHIEHANDRRPIHENSYQYVMCYELARDQGYWYRCGDNKRAALIMQKHHNYPRFRIFNFSLTLDELIELARYLSPISMQAIRALHVSPEEAAELKRRFRGGWIGKRQQAIYRTDRCTPERLNRRGQEMYRTCDRRIIWGPSSISANYDAMKGVVNRWKSFNEHKHRQLAITRDYESLALGQNDDVVRGFMGQQGPTLDECSCIHILDRISSHPNAYAQIVEKSLNYSAIPGGRPGTADYNLIKTCEYLREMKGCEFINAGGYDGGGWGLPQHKAVFALPEDDIYSYTFDFPFDYMNKEKTYV